jgi:hypothetical protein
VATTRVGTATKADAYNAEHPPPPAPKLDDTDLDRPAFGSEPFTDRDREVLKQLLLLQFGADTVKGWDNAVALLGHWLAVRATRTGSILPRCLVTSQG